MNTLLLAVGAYLLLGNQSSAPQQPPPQQAPKPAAPSGGADLAAAFGAFVGGLIAQASKD